MTPGTQHDQIIVTLSITLDGELRVSFFGGYVPNFNDNFVILQAGSIIGRWSNALDGFYDGFNFRMSVQYSPTFVALSEFTAVPEPGTLALIGLGSLGMLFARRVRTLARASS